MHAVRTIFERELDGLLRHAARLRVHRHLPGAARASFTFFLGGFFERGQADLAPFFIFHPWLYLFLVPGDRHAAVGRGAADRHDRAADDPADHDLCGRARQVPGRLGVRRHRARC